MSEANGAVFMPGAFGAVQAELTVSLSSEQGPPLQLWGSQIPCC